MMSPLVPLQGKIVVKPAEAEKERVTKGGIHLPDIAKEQETRQGTVLAVGIARTTTDGKKLPLQLAEGQIVYYGKWAGNVINVSGDDFVVLDFDSVLAVSRVEPVAGPVELSDEEREDAIPALPAKRRLARTA